jgi:hypothetical protein
MRAERFLSRGPPPAVVAAGSVAQHITAQHGRLRWTTGGGAPHASAPRTSSHDTPRGLVLVLVLVRPVSPAELVVVSRGLSGPSSPIAVAAGRHGAAARGRGSDGWVRASVASGFGSSGANSSLCHARAQGSGAPAVVAHGSGGAHAPGGRVRRRRRVSHSKGGGGRACRGLLGHLPGPRLAADCATGRRVSTSL